MTKRLSMVAAAALSCVCWVGGAAPAMGGQDEDVADIGEGGIVGDEAAEAGHGEAAGEGWHAFGAGWRRAVDAVAARMG